ncbi:MAG: hypothetical protein ABI839_02605 [Verrucomicrobiota bacterium]
MMRYFALFVATVLTLQFASAQTAAPVVVPAAAPVSTAPATHLESNINESQLIELKTVNEEILKRQQATLEALDQIISDAEQLRIFSKRG